MNALDFVLVLVAWGFAMSTIYLLYLRLRDREAMLEWKAWKNQIEFYRKQGRTVYLVAGSPGMGTDEDHGTIDTGARA